MKIKDKSVAIVLAGKWNLFILTPEWVINNLYEDHPEVKIEFSVNFDAPIRFRIKDIIFCPTPDKVLLIAITPTEDTLAELERIAIRLYTILSHTPLNAVGVNFGFIEEVNKDHLFPIFNYSDKDSLSENQWEIKNASLKRQMIKDGVLLNLTLVLDGNNNVHFDFNFHFDFDQNKQLEELLGKKSIQCYHYAIEVLESIYHLNFEQHE
jgi:hypothetical protein